jgi:hypothetical protein
VHRVLTDELLRSAETGICYTGLTGQCSTYQAHRYWHCSTIMHVSTPFDSLMQQALFDSLIQQALLILS